jgi:hypothetical protein
MARNGSVHYAEQSWRYSIPLLGMQYTQEFKRLEIVAYFYCDYNGNGLNRFIHNHSHIGGSDMHFTPIGFSGKEVLRQLVKGSGKPLPIFCGETQWKKTIV